MTVHVSICTSSFTEQYETDIYTIRIQANSENRFDPAVLKGAPTSAGLEPELAFGTLSKFPASCL